MKEGCKEEGPLSRHTLNTNPNIVWLLRSSLSLLKDLVGLRPLDRIVWPSLPPAPPHHGEGQVDCDSDNNSQQQGPSLAPGLPELLAHPLALLPLLIDLFFKLVKFLLVQVELLPDCLAHLCILACLLLASFLADLLVALLSNFLLGSSLCL